MAVLEDLSESERYLFALLQDQSGIDHAEFFWRDTSEESEFGIWRAWPFQWKWYKDEATLQIEQSCRCVKQDTPVLTEDGWIPIQKVRIGQRVLTHKGRWKRVTEVFDNGTKPLVAISGQGPADPLYVTSDHLLWGAHVVRGSASKDGHRGKKLLTPQWMSASEFLPNDGSMQMQSNWASPSSVEGLSPPPQMQPAYRSGRQNYVKDYLVPDFMWLMGLFMAEGSTWISDKNSTARWSVHISEVDTVTECLDRVGLNWNISKVQTSDQCKNVCVNSKPLAQFLELHCGKIHNNKKVPTWVYGLDDQLRQAVLDGALYGDGHLRPTGRQEHSTTSRALGLGLKILAQTLGKSSSMSVAREPGTTTIRGKTYKTKRAYTISVYDLELQTGANMKILDGQAWYPVQDVRPAGFAPTWDLEVEDDHSFIADGVVVHNSLGKSVSIKLRMFAFPFLHPGQEAVVTAPQLIHLLPIIGLIENQFLNTRIGREMLPTGKNNGITHRPFECIFRNSARILGRIPQDSGLGLKGCVGAGTIVLTERGLIPVEGVVEGDKVWTHKHRWSPVVVVQEFEDDVVEIKVEGLESMVVSTGHIVWVRGSDGDEWKTVADLSPGSDSLIAGENVAYRLEEIVYLSDARKVYNIISDDHSYWGGVFHHNTHPLWLEQDESQNFTEEAWAEIFETLKQGSESKKWRAHGVPRGVRDTFYKLTQPGSGWKVHRYQAQWRPTWTDEERAQKIEMYGSRNAPDYKRNVKGEHGDSTAPIFITSRLMQNVCEDQSDPYNTEEYQNIRINHEMIEDADSPISFFLDFPSTHRKYKTIWVGMDVGYTLAPSEILVFAEEHIKGMEQSRLKLITRIHLERVSHQDQVAAILHVVNWYKVKAFSMDRTGLGLPLFQDIQQHDLKSAHLIKGYNFSEKIAVEIDETMEIDEFKGTIEDKLIKRSVLEASTDILRDLVDHKRLWLPWDRDLLGEYMGQSYTIKRDGVNMYGRREYSQGQFHALDASRMAVLGWSQERMELIMKPPVQEAVIPVFMNF